ncbi:MAG: FN3 associated domain-containing protein [Bacteroidota bacterium]
MKLRKILAACLLPLNVLLLFFLVFEDRLLVPAWLRVFGRMHPLIVHFPIVLILVYFACVFFIPKKFKNEKWYVTMLEVVLLVAALSSVITALMGLFLSREEGYDQDTLAWHKWTGVATSFGLFLLFSFNKKLQQYATVNYILVFSVGLIVVLAGHLGGNITHGENYVLAPVTPQNKKIRAAFEDAFVYADMVQPILESKCYSCHNSKKAKGELIMETKELLLKGGKDGKLWDSTKADLGLMMQRIHLPEEEKEHMPPAGKPQLTNDELEILYEWVKAGANFERKVTDLLSTDTMRVLAAKVLKQSTDEHYDFAAASEKEIQKLSNDNRVIAPLFLNSPALVVNFYNRSFYSAEKLNELKPLNKQIVEMNLDNMPVKDDDLKIISSFTNLRKLNLDFTTVTGTTLAELKKLINLKSLSLSGTTVKPDQLKNLVSLPKLKMLYLWNTDVAAADIKKLQEQNKNIAYQSGFKGDTVVLKLTPPILENEDQVIVAATPVKLKHYIHGTTIRYTLDGTEPDSLSSPIYDNKLEINSGVTIKAKAFKPGWIGSDVIEQHFFKSTYRPDSVVLVTPVDPKYKGNGGKTLIDLEKSDLSFGNGKWLAYRQNPMEAMLVFGKAIDAKSVTLSMLKNVPGFILPPASIEVWGGLEENKMKLLSKLNPKQPTKESENSENLAIECSFNPTEVKFIKLLVKPVAKLPQWHAGKGEKAWIFIDEVFVN